MDKLILGGDIVLSESEQVLLASMQSLTTPNLVLFISQHLSPKSMVIITKLTALTMNFQSSSCCHSLPHEPFVPNLDL